MTTDLVKEQFKSPWLSPVEMTIFLFILAVGLAYAWKKGALKWE